jgi:hypothetical protein
MEGLLAYSDRHYQRLERLLQKSYLIDYTLHRIQRLPSVVVQQGNEAKTTKKKNLKLK